MAQSRQLGADVGLSTRMFITMFMLAVLYTGFMWVLINAGVDTTMVIFIAAVMLGLQYFYSDKLVLMSMGARVVDPAQAPELHAMVGRLSAMANLPMPKVAVIDSDMPNAFATGRSPNHAVVAVTQGLLRRLNREEVEAVLAHEISHIRHRDVAVMTLASFFATVAQLLIRWLQWSVFYGAGGRRRDDDRSGLGIYAVWLVSMLVWLISFFLIRALSRYREFAADRGASILTGAPGNLASALTKISGVMSRIPTQDLRQAEAFNAFFIIPALRGSSIAELFSTHPSLEKRLANLQRIQQEMLRR
ncbi:MAG TPA: zinc metalloprotease HtpX [Firmicutes bacterium]|nr:zinc metalloprotease HtpX [Bacillota bacterium]